jgi:DNA-directed RNA polymerase specialized sigma24 family protein
MIMDAADPVLQPFLESPEPWETERLLAVLLSDHAKPIIDAIARSRIRGYRAGGPQAQDVEDVTGEAMYHLLERLRAIKRGEGEPITNFAGYVATTARHACAAYVRRRYPARASVKSRLRYFLSHRPEWAVWDGPADSLLGGPSKWRGETRGQWRIPAVCADQDGPGAVGA